MARQQRPQRPCSGISRFSTGGGCPLHWVTVDVGRWQRRRRDVQRRRVRGPSPRAPPHGAGKNHSSYLLYTYRPAHKRHNGRSGGGTATRSTEYPPCENTSKRNGGVWREGENMAATTPNFNKGRHHTQTYLARTAHGARRTTVVRAVGRKVAERVGRQPMRGASSKIHQQETRNAAPGAAGEAHDEHAEKRVRRAQGMAQRLVPWPPQVKNYTRRRREWKEAGRNKAGTAATGYPVATNRRSKGRKPGTTRQLALPQRS